MSERVAIIGVGQTKYAACREDVSLPGLLREAVLRAMEDAAVLPEDIDAVVLGTAPDFFEGVMQPELYLADALFANNKPIMRVHTAGSVGGSTAIVAAGLIATGVHRRVLTVCFEKQSESNAMWALSAPIPFQPQLVAGAGGYFAPLVRSYIRRSGAPEEVGAVVAVKDREHGRLNPYAHLHIEETLETVRKSPMLWDPIRYAETCPSSDGAVAMVLSNEKFAHRTSRRPAWIHGMAMRTEPTFFAGRDQVNPQASRDCAREVYSMAGITNPYEEIDVAELYVPFTWFEPMWLESLGFAEVNQGWRLTLAGKTKLGSELPINPSGGVLCTNPIGASGMIRFAEAAQQVRELAGDHQVPGARRAVGHAYGGGSQFFSMWVVGSDPP